MPMPPTTSPVSIPLLVEQLELLRKLVDAQERQIKFARAAGDAKTPKIQDFGFPKASDVYPGLPRKDDQHVQIANHDDQTGDAKQGMSGAELTDCELCGPSGETLHVQQEPATNAAVSSESVPPAQGTVDSKGLPLAADGPRLTQSDNPKVSKRSKQSRNRISMIDEEFHYMCFQLSNSESGIDLTCRTTELPPEMSLDVLRLLILSALLPACWIQSQSRRSIYQAYSWLYSVSLIIGIVVGIAMTFVSAHYHGEFPPMSILWTLFVSAAFAFRLLFRAQLLPSGATMALAHQLSKHGFEWECLRWSVRFIYAAVVLTLTIFSISFLVDVAQEDTLPQMTASKSSAFSIACWCLFIPFPLWSLVGCLAIFSLPWFVFFLSRLHQYDLLGYANAITTIIVPDPKDIGPQDPVATMNLIELTLSQRFRTMSSNVVKWVVLWILFCVLVCTVGSMHLGFGHVKKTGDLIRGTVVLVMLGALICGLAIPLASVSETFEYDVIRTLNSPAIMNGSQKYFGQQFLNHLKLLDWGFRFGGTVIQMRSCTRMVSGLALALLVSVAQSVMRARGHIEQ